MTPCKVGQGMYLFLFHLDKKTWMKKCSDWLSLVLAIPIACWAFIIEPIKLAFILSGVCSPSEANYCSNPFEVFIRFLKADSKKRKPFPLHWKIWFPQANCCDDIGHDITRLLLLLVGWLLSFMPQEVSVYYIWKMSTCETNQTTTYHIVGQIMS